MAVDCLVSASKSRQPDAILLAIGWGALWGVALGFWLLAPTILDTHHLRPGTVAQWTTLLGALSVIFAALGALLGFAGSFLLLAVESVAGGAFADRTWAYGLFTGVTVSLAYAIESFFIQWQNYGSLELSPADQRGTVVFLVACVIACGSCAVLYRTIRRDRAPAVLRRTVAAMAFAGAAALAWRAPADTVSPGDAVSIRRLSPPAPDVPLLFIGLDGGTWRVLQPAMARGAAPTFQRLASRGLTGTVDALWPPYWSGAAWASIVTGLPREQTGVYEDLAATAPGLPLFQVPIATALRMNPLYSVRTLLLASGVISYTPPPRALLRQKPIWQLLHESGVNVAVVRFRFTYPPQGQGDVVVSDWVGRDQWEALGVERAPDADTVTPAAESTRLLAPFRAEHPLPPGLLSQLLPGPRPRKPADVIGDPIEQLEIALDVDSRTFDVGELILRREPRQSFLAIYIGGLDTVQHAFWQYSFPDDFPEASPDPQDTDRLAPVLERYVHYLDDRVARLLALYAREPNVLIVSDHGFGATTSLAQWRGWHEGDGVFLASGPSIPGSKDPIPVSYYAIAPTIAHLKGFVAASPSARSVLPQGGNE